MLINRHNYEEYFLLYVDNELNAAEREAVEAFVEANPDLEEELVMMMQSVLRPDPKVVFTNKESLFKNIPADGLVNESNYEEYFVLYGDNELTNEEKAQVEQFVYKHPQYQAEFELIQQAKLIPDHSIIYPDKNELFRSEEDERVIPFRWWKLAAAAIVLLFLGITAWYMLQEKKTGNTTGPQMATETKSNDNNQQKEVVPPAVIKKQEESAINEMQKNLAAVEDKVEEKQKKSATKSNIEATRIVTPQSAIEKNDMAANEVKPEVKTENNPLPIPEEVYVEDNSIKPVYANVVANTGSPKTDVATLTNEPGTTIAQKQQAVYYYVDEEEEDQIKFANASISKKPVRGLIKKVKGLFEGNNEMDEQPEPENKKGIRIAAFSIALR